MGRSIEAHVSQTDAFTLALERDPLLRSTIVAVAVFDRTPDWPVLRDRIDRATRLAPTFREKLVPTPLGLAPPRWIVDADFDLDWHLRRGAVRTGGDLADVVEFARTAGMTAFDPERPLWEFTLLEGLPDGGAALVLKVHHALTDGIGGIQLAAHVVDLQRDWPDLGPLPPAPSPRDHGLLETVADTITHDLRHAVDLGAGVARAVPGLALGALRDPIGSATGAAATVRSIARMVRPVQDTRSPVMTERRLQWHYDAMEVPFADLHAAGAAIDGTLNDAFVAAIAGGLRLYHADHDAPVDALRITMPISIRTDHDAEGGNHITLVRFEAPVGIEDPLERMRAVHDQCRTLRQEPAIPYSNAIAAVLNLLPVSVTGGMLKHVDLLASNVPGFDAEIFVAGGRVDAFYAFGPTTGAAANITLLSYRGTCYLGVTTDVGAVPDPDHLLACLREGFAEVTAVG